MRTLVVFLSACLLAASVPLLDPGPAASAAGFPGWPDSFEGRSLRAEPLNRIEQNAERSFPGRMGRFTDGQRQIVFRWINRPSRTLHAPEACFRGSGYRVVPGPLVRDNDGILWSTFKAERAGERLIVRTLIQDMQGQSWQDVSGWFWSASLGRSAGPWWAVTVAERAPEGPE